MPKNARRANRIVVRASNPFRICAGCMKMLPDHKMYKLKTSPFDMGAEAEYVDYWCSTCMRNLRAELEEAK